jgi:hypothetical protein
MGFFSRLFGGSPKPASSNVASEQLGTALFERAIQRFQECHAQLEGMGTFSQRPDLRESKQCVVGLITLTVASLEQVLTDVPFPEMRAARPAVRAAMFQKFKPSDPTRQNALLDKVMGTYAHAARSADFSTLGRLAAEATGLPATTDMEKFLSSFYMSSLNTWLDVLSEFGFETS